MLSLIEVLRKHKAIINDGAVIITPQNIRDAADEYVHDSIVRELESLLETNSTQAYWPAIIKERIKQLKGDNNG